MKIFQFDRRESREKSVENSAAGDFAPRASRRAMARFT